MDEPETMKCPIKGCGHEFAHGIRGWDAHVGVVDNHPTWHPKVKSLKARKETFQREYPTFFEKSETTQQMQKSGPQHKPSGVFLKAREMDRAAVILRQLAAYLEATKEPEPERKTG